MSKKLSWFALLLPLCSLPVTLTSNAQATTWCDGAASGYYDCGNGWSCGYSNGDTTRGCVWHRDDHSDHSDHNYRGTTWCSETDDTGYYDCGNGWSCGNVRGDSTHGCVWDHGKAPRSGAHPGGNTGGGNPGGGNATWPACDSTAQGRFDCGNGRSCGYPNGNTETACTYL